MKNKLVIMIVLLSIATVLFAGCGGGGNVSDKGNHTKNRQTTVNDILKEKTSQDEESTGESQDRSKDDDNSSNASSKKDKSDKESKANGTADSKNKNDNSEVKQSEKAASASGKSGKSKSSESDSVDVDLTTLSSTMVYSEVFSMMAVPQEYVGKRIKMKGLFAYYQDTQTNKDYFACIIQDATACCSQGIEFELEGDHKYPRDYPKLDENFCVQGIFEEYEENGLKFYRLAHAKIVK